MEKSDSRVTYFTVPSQGSMQANLITCSKIGKGYNAKANKICQPNF